MILVYIFEYRYSFFSGWRIDFGAWRMTHGILTT